MPSFSQAPGEFPAFDPLDPSRFGEDAVDPELLALPAPPRRERTITLVVLFVTAFACFAMAAALRTDATYFFAPSTPVDLGDIAKAPVSAVAANQYVQMSGLLGARTAIRYERAFESDTFRVHPAIGRNDLFVELRLRAGEESPRYVPPGTFRGRAVPLRLAGLRYRGLAKAIEAKTGIAPADNALLVVDGEPPSDARTSLMLVILFAVFGIWNLAAMFRIVKRAS